MHNRHFLGHNQSPLLQKRLAWLLIITLGRKVSVLGLVTKSILKICIWQQLGVLGRASCSEKKEGACVTTTKKRIIFQSKDTVVVWGYVADRQAEIRLGLGQGLLHVVIIEKLSMFISQTKKISAEDALPSTNIPLPSTSTGKIS